MMRCRVVETPTDPNVKWNAASENERYQRLAGTLIYLSHTRPDIAFAVSVINWFMHAPEPAHFEAVFSILRCLKGTPAHVAHVAHGFCEYCGVKNSSRSWRSLAHNPILHDMLKWISTSLKKNWRWWNLHVRQTYHRSSSGCSLYN